MPVVAITRTSTGAYPLYISWLRRIDSRVEIVELESETDPVAALRRSNGLLLPGGADVDPAHFGKRDERPLCTIDAARDALEFTSIEAALGCDLPILGICRGLQIMNVFLGGSLLTHLPATGISGHGKIDGKDAEHEVWIEPASLLGGILGGARGKVNSAHHQAADRVADALVVTARSRDGVIEGLEWKSPSGNGYLQLVQWHPERMADAASPFSENIASDFLHAVKGT